MQQIRALTSLRGLAVLIVFASHSANMGLLPQELGRGFGQVGVMLFYTLSGFLMTYLYLGKNFDADHVRGYVGARLGRVFPLYYLVVVLSILICRFTAPGGSFPYRFDDLGVSVRALFLIEAQSALWSIPVEVQFYLIFMFLWWLKSRGFSFFLLLLVMALLSIPAVIIYLVDEDAPETVFIYSHSFFIGVITAHFYPALRNSTALRLWSARLGAFALLFLFSNLPEVRSKLGLGLGDGLLKTWLDPLSWIGVYLVFLCCVIESPGIKILNNALLEYLGRTSYGFYLLHYPALSVLVKEFELPNSLKLLLAFVLVVSLSHLSLSFYERPAGNKLKAWLKTSGPGRSRPSPSIAKATPSSAVQHAAQEGHLEPIQSE